MVQYYRTRKPQPLVTGGVDAKQMVFTQFGLAILANDPEYYVHIPCSARVNFVVA